MKKDEIIARAGLNTGNNKGANASAFLFIEHHTRDEGNLNYKIEQVAHFSIMYLPDTNEVAFVKHVDGGEDEILFSELLP